MSISSPGPWAIHGDETRQAFYVHGANVICDMRKPSGFYRSPAETEANARLIAAAPDLLATLRAIANDCEDYLNNDSDCGSDDLIQAFLSAINEVHDKATGSTFASDTPADEYGEAVQPC